MYVRMLRSHGTGRNFNQLKIRALRCKSCENVDAWSENRAIFVWPWNENGQKKKQKQETNGNRSFSLTWSTSMQIYWNKRKRLHKKRVQIPQDWFGTPTWPPFHCFGTPRWPPWRHVKTLHRTIWLVYRTDTNAPGFWLVKRTLGWKNFMPENFLEINRYFALTTYCNTIGWSNNNFSII